MADPQLLGRPRRRLVVTVRGAADVPAANSKPYVLLQLGEDKVQTSPAEVGGANPVWDEELELRLPPARPNEPPLPVKVRLMEQVRLFPDRFLGSGATQLTDLMYGGGTHEVKVRLTDRGGAPAGHLHLGLLLEKEQAPGERVGTAAGTVLGEVPGGPGPASPTAAAVPGPVLPSAAEGEMQAREALGAGNLMDPSKPGFGLHMG